MDIALDKVCELILRARAIDVKEGLTDPASGSNPIDDGSIDSLTSAPDDATEDEGAKTLPTLLAVHLTDLTIPKCSSARSAT